MAPFARKLATAATISVLATGCSAQQDSDAGPSTSVATPSSTADVPGVIRTSATLALDFGAKSMLDFQKPVWSRTSSRGVLPQ